MKAYESIHLVTEEDLNHHETLFAARAASWFVESGFVAAACENGNTHEIVLRNVHRMSFQQPVNKGTVITFRSKVVFLGNSSIMVYIEAEDAITHQTYLDGFITFVTIDTASKQKKLHNLTMDITEEPKELQIREEALRLRQQG